MFRRDKSLPLDADLVKALYRGVLRREPAPVEIDNLIKALSNAVSVEHALKDMLSSHEFGVMVLPNLINEYMSAVPTRPVFFLHIPKTAGTSFRLALTDTLGIPAFLLYEHSSWKGFGKNDTMNFWPLWAGHAGVSTFPQTHRGITVFREPRSRALSAYRQQESELALENFSLVRFSRDDGLTANPKRVVTAADPFAEWIKLVQGSTPWFLEAPREAKNQLWDGRPSIACVRALNQTETRKMLSRTLGRFDSAAWAHDSESMTTSIEKIVGKPMVSEIGRENLFEVESKTKPTVLTADDLVQLDRIAAADRVLFETAVDKGLIAPLDQDFADAEFERTAQRLGFTLP